MTVSYGGSTKPKFRDYMFLLGTFYSFLMIVIYIVENYWQIHSTMDKLGQT